MALPIYIASLLGAAGLLLTLPKRSINLAPLGAVLFAGLPGLVWVAAALLGETPTGTDTATAGHGLGDAWPFYYVFSALAIGSAVRVITHRRPVYAALWFVMVVLASAGLFLTLDAEFMAFALVLIYAGAILVTYMFVIMLATQAKSADATDVQLPEFERIAREPLAAVAAGFLLLAVLLTVAFDDASLRPNPAAAAMSDAALAAEVLGDRAVDAPAITNAERLGVDLFRGNPLGLELAGIVLLVALVGAVVIAKTRVFDEDRVIADDEIQTGPRPTDRGEAADA